MPAKKRKKPSTRHPLKAESVWGRTKQELEGALTNAMAETIARKPTKREQEVQDAYRRGVRMGEEQMRKWAEEERARAKSEMNEARLKATTLLMEKVATSLDALAHVVTSLRDLRP